MRAGEGSGCSCLAGGPPRPLPAGRGAGCPGGSHQGQEAGWGRTRGQCLHPALPADTLPTSHSWGRAGLGRIWGSAGSQKREGLEPKGPGGLLSPLLTRVSEPQCPRGTEQDDRLQAEGRDGSAPL